MLWQCAEPAVSTRLSRYEDSACASTSTGTAWRSEADCSCVNLDAEVHSVQAQVRTKVS